jgi:four helix bundle protein
MDGDHRRSHKDLIVWRKALDLATLIYRITARFPRFELFGLASQLRRAAVSVPSNIAEGTARRTTREFVAYLHFARGSLAELETQILLAVQVGYLDEVETLQVQRGIDEVGRLINGVLRSLKTRAASETEPGSTLGSGISPTLRPIS